MSLKTLLVKLSQHLIAKDNEHRIGAENAAGEVFQLLKTHCKRHLARFVVAGTLGAKWKWPDPSASTNAADDPSQNVVMPSDLDLVIFVQKLNPPFQEILQEFAEIFSQNSECEIVNTSHSLYIGIIYKRLKIHIFPAVDFLVQEKNRPPSEDVDYQNQYKLTKTKIMQSPSPIQTAFSYGTSMAETTTAFVKGQSELIHSVIILGKFWIRQIVLEEEIDIHRRAYLVECVAIHAVGQTKKQEDLLEAFTHFLALVTNFSKLKILAIPGGRTDNKEIWKDVKGPIVSDPITPFHNLARFRGDPKLQEEILSCLQTAAMFTLWKFEAVKNGNIRIESLEDLAGIFAQRKARTLRSQARNRIHGDAGRPPRHPLVWVILLCLSPILLLKVGWRFLKKHPIILGAIFAVLIALRMHSDNFFS